MTTRRSSDTLMAGVVVLTTDGAVVVGVAGTGVVGGSVLVGDADGDDTSDDEGVATIGDDDSATLACPVDVSGIAELAVLRAGGSAEVSITPDVDTVHDTPRSELDVPDTLVVAKNSELGISTEDGVTLDVTDNIMDDVMVAEGRGGVKPSVAKPDVCTDVGNIADMDEAKALDASETPDVDRTDVSTIPDTVVMTDREDGCRPVVGVSDCVREPGTVCSVAELATDSTLVSEAGTVTSIMENSVVTLTDDGTTMLSV